MSAFDTFAKISNIPTVLNSSNEYCEFAYLKLFVDPEFPKLREMYKEHIKNHNDGLNIKYIEDDNTYRVYNDYPNSGFDLLVPHELVCPGSTPETVSMAKLKVKAEMFTVDTIDLIKEPCAYFLMPRSSIAKTPLMQANHVGLIDSGYRGEIMGALRNLSKENYKIEEYTRLFQVCHPLTIPIWVELVDRLDDLSCTDRGTGGFGSTGNTGAISR